MKHIEESYNKLSYAFALYVRQQSERLFFGGKAEYDEIAAENKALAKEVLPILEKHLDEDLVDELDHMQDDYSINFVKAWSNLANFWTPFAGFMPGLGRRSLPPRFSGVEVNRILADFTMDLNNRRKRDSKKFSAQDLQDMIKDLEKDLKETLFKDEQTSSAAKK